MEGPESTVPTVEELEAMTLSERANQMRERSIALDQLPSEMQERIRARGLELFAERETRVA